MPQTTMNVIIGINILRKSKSIIYKLSRLKYDNLYIMDEKIVITESPNLKSLNTSVSVSEPKKSNMMDSLKNTFSSSTPSQIPIYNIFCVWIDRYALFIKVRKIDTISYFFLSLQ